VVSLSLKRLERLEHLERMELAQRGHLPFTDENPGNYDLGLRSLERQLANLC
jgi:hypothetical protein